MPARPGQAGCPVPFVTFRLIGRQGWFFVYFAPLRTALLDLKEEEILGPDLAAHWYYVSKGRALTDMLAGIEAKAVLDIGAGSGVFARRLLDTGLVRSATCVDPFYSDERLADVSRPDLRFVRDLGEQNQDLILFMDVLEHVDDDLALLRSYTDRLTPAGHVLITVPAFQWLWSGHDVFLEHRRRYTLAETEALVRRAGLEPVAGRYFFGLLFPAVAALRLGDRIKNGSRPAEAKSQLRKASDRMNRLLVGIHDAERRWVFPWNRLFGLSVFCLATRR